MKTKLPPALPLQGKELSEATVRILNIIEGMLTQIVWWAQFKPILDEQIHERERLALAWVDQTVGEMTLIRTRVFDDFCSGKDATPPKAKDPKDRDLVLANFPGLNLGGGFFIGDQREKINQTVAHSTHKYLGQPEVPHNYKEILRAAIPKAKQFCRYVESTLAGSVPERVEHAKDVLNKLEWMEQFYVNVKSIPKPPADAHFSI